ncbi:MAG TPA: calcium-binding protein [Phenylobacterium sp.]|jgi:Ca2+-binding RTX toxin-like protein
MPGKTDFIVNGSFERVGGGDAAAWIEQSPQFDVALDGQTYQFRPGQPPDGWTVTNGFFAVEDTVDVAKRASWDGKVWGLAHNGAIAQQVTGLTAGAVYDLAFIAFHPVWPDPSELQVFWNGQMVADFQNLHADVGGMTHLLVTSGAGTNQLELRTSSVVTIDDIRLFAAGPGDTADYALATQAVGVNLSDEVFRSQYPDVPGMPVLPTLSAMHAYTGSGGQPLNGVSNLVGSAFNDLLVAATRGGTLAGGAGDDALIGGPGDDTINGGTGADLIIGGDGKNYLRGDDGDDSIAGGAGFDDINGNVGNDTCASGGGDDWVVGGKGDDSLAGSAGQNLVYGNIGNDTCDGGAGDDVVRGGQDNDVVRGGDGNDFVSGDKGNDTMTGGAGADIFHTFGDAGIDRVTDFNLAQGDRVQVDPGTVFTVSQSGADTLITMQGGAQMILVGVQMATLTPGWIFGA